MPPAEIERELNESNGVDTNMLALPPRVLVTRSILDNVDHGPIMIAFCNKTDAAHYKAYGVPSEAITATPETTLKREDQQIPQLPRTHTLDTQLQPQTKVRTRYQHRTRFGRPPQVGMQGMREGDEMPAQ